MKKYFTFLIINIALLSLFSCKEKAQDFNGTWELITAPVTGFDYFWELHDTDNKEGLVSIYMVDTLNGTVDTCSKGDFFVKNNVITIGAPIAFCEWTVYDGEWDVHRLNGQFMTLIRYLPRGTIYLEFAKR
jgi:hypothetical protein